MLSLVDVENKEMDVAQIGMKIEEGRSTEAEDRRELKGNTTGHAALRLVTPRNIADQ